MKKFLLFLVVMMVGNSIHSYSQSFDYSRYYNQLMQKAQNMGNEISKESQRMSQLAASSTNKDVYVLYYNGQKMGNFPDELSCKAQINSIKTQLNSYMASIIDGLPAQYRTEARNAINGYMNQINFTYRKESNPNYRPPSNLTTNNNGINGNGANDMSNYFQKANRYYQEHGGYSPLNQKEKETPDAPAGDTNNPMESLIVSHDKNNTSQTGEDALMVKSTDSSNSQENKNSSGKAAETQLGSGSITYNPKTGVTETGAYKKQVTPNLSAGIAATKNGKKGLTDLTVNTQGTLGDTQGTLSVTHNPSNGDAGATLAVQQKVSNNFSVGASEAEKNGKIGSTTGTIQATSGGTQVTLSDTHNPNNSENKTAVENAATVTVQQQYKDNTAKVSYTANQGKDNTYSVEDQQKFTDNVSAGMTVKGTDTKAASGEAVNVTYGKTGETTVSGEVSTDNNKNHEAGIKLNIPLGNNSSKKPAITTPSPPQTEKKVYSWDDILSGKWGTK